MGTVSVYQASSREKICEHAARVGLPVTEIVDVAETMLVRPDPGAVTDAAPVRDVVPHVAGVVGHGRPNLARSDGGPTVRLRDGERTLDEGDVLPLPRGPEGGHQVRNDSDSVARVLIVSSNADPDVAEYPDTGKVGFRTDGGWEFYRRSDAVEHAGPE